MRLIVFLACFAGLTAVAGSFLAPAVAQPAAQTGLVLVVEATGDVRATGRVPRDFPVKALKKRIPGIDLTGGLASGGDGDPAAWERALDALTIVLPRLRDGEARIAGRRIGISGTLLPGFNAETTRGAIRLAVGAAWEVEIELAETPPPAAVTWERAVSGIEFSGILPAGIDPPQALSLLGGARNGGLSGGGGGDAAAWEAALARLGEVVPLYADTSGSIADGTVEIGGTLLPGYQAVALGAWLATELGESWQVGLAGRETPARDGDTRRDLATGRIERLRRGRWMPELDFEPGVQSCIIQTEAALSRGGIAFVVGKSQVDEAARPILDRLAGVAIRCLNQGGLKLGIGGHTDNIGDAASNLALSRKRAMAVLLELMDYGVRADGMSAIGYGETRPIADSGSAQGLAMNRRITFEWSE